MRLIGVIDLLEGAAVHAQLGLRDRYQPLANADALALAQRYVAEFGLGELYVADLNAILGREAQDSLVAGVCSSGAQIWLDAGIASAERAREAHALGVTHVVIGLETLSSFEGLDEICATLGGDCVAFSLDLRNGDPVGAAGQGMEPHQIAERAVRAGVNSILLLDLARMGSDNGPDIETIAAVREAMPEHLLLAGGGIRGLGDLSRLADAGCDGALLATALHTGAVSAADLQAARHFKVRR